MKLQLLQTASGKIKTYSLLLSTLPKLIQQTIHDVTTSSTKRGAVSCRRLIVLAHIYANHMSIRIRAVNSALVAVVFDLFAIKSKIQACFVSNRTQFSWLSDDKYLRLLIAQHWQYVSGMILYWLLPTQRPVLRQE